MLRKLRTALSQIDVGVSVLTCGAALAAAARATRANILNGVHFMFGYSVCVCVVMCMGGGEGGRGSMVGTALPRWA